MPSTSTSSTSQRHNQTTSATRLPTTTTELSTNTKTINITYPRRGAVTRYKQHTKPALSVTHPEATIGHPKSQPVNAINDAAKTISRVSCGPIPTTSVQNTKKAKNTTVPARTSKTTTKARTSLKPTSSTTTTSMTFVTAPQTEIEPKSRVDTGIIKMCSGAVSGTSGLVKRFVEQMEKGKTNASTVEGDSQVKNEGRRKGTKILQTKSENKRDVLQSVEGRPTAVMCSALRYAALVQERSSVFQQNSQVPEVGEQHMKRKASAPHLARRMRPRVQDSEQDPEDAFYPKRNPKDAIAGRPYTLTPPPLIPCPEDWEEMQELCSPCYGHSRSSDSNSSRLREGVVLRYAMRTHGSPVPNCTLEELAQRMPTSPLSWPPKKGKEGLAKGKRPDVVGKKSGPITRIPTKRDQLKWR